MFVNELNNLQFYSQLSLKHVEDRLLITADFPQQFLIDNKMIEPFLYVTLYVRGGVMVKIIDEGTAKLYTPSRKEFDPDTFKQIVQFAMDHSQQFKNQSIK
ncbi:hypothetical protein [Aquibacillus rhizosphaerae]|uniref:YokE-like PH domain-containing protein n=1 Tax=Aquibacillus rhizosphaerae TaxID=3051431 RepID=A0ABT7L4S5_9BACI|nr:hypothetical protein [Aquibacillus sp. LR5S19]MDL4840849.1 hypothetical protein [Aquibacillus sp. LR5S19]